MTATIVIQASSVRNGLAHARRELGLALKDSRELTRSGGEDGLYRCHLAGGHVVELTVRQHARAETITAYSDI